MSNIVSGRQLRSARALAGLTQRRMAQEVGVHERAARYWEARDDKLPTCVPSSLEKIEAVLNHHGVIVFATPVRVPVLNTNDLPDSGSFFSERRKSKILDSLIRSYSYE